VILLSPNITHIFLVAAGAAGAVVVLRVVLAAGLRRDLGRVPLGRNVLPLATVGNLAALIAMVAGVGVYAAVALPRSVWVAYPTSCDQSLFSLRGTNSARVSGPRWPPVQLPRLVSVASVKATLGLAKLVEIDPGHPNNVSVKQQDDTGAVIVTMREGTFQSLRQLQSKVRAEFDRNGLHAGSRSSTSGTGTLDSFSYGTSNFGEGVNQSVVAEQCGSNRPTRVTVTVTIAKEQVGDCASAARHAACGVLYGVVDRIGLDSTRTPATVRHRVSATKDARLVLAYDQPTPLSAPSFFAERGIRDALARDGWTVEPAKSAQDPLGFPTFRPDLPADVRAQLTREGVRYRFRARLTGTDAQVYLTCRVESLGPVG
jgi:hypothetical protein